MPVKGERLGFRVWLELLLNGVIQRRLIRTPQRKAPDTVQPTAWRAILQILQNAPGGITTGCPNAAFVLDIGVV